MRRLAVLALTLLVVTVLSVFSGDPVLQKSQAGSDPVPLRYDRLDGTGESGKKVNVIEWEGNLEIHVYPKGSVKGLAMKLDDADKDDRWRVAALVMDQSMIEFGLDLAQRHAFAETRARAFLEEFEPWPTLKESLGRRYRSLRAGFEEIVRRTGGSALELAGPALAERSRRFPPLVDALVQAHRAGDLWAPPEELLASYLHMSVNRLLRSSLRAQELVLYEFLRRTYRSCLARRADDP